MARVANIQIPDKKRLAVALTYIYGIGPDLAKQICVKLNVTLDRKVNSLSEKELIQLRKIVSEEYKVEGELRKEVSLNIKAKKDIKSYQGIRHTKRLPVRGQNTKTNARTKRGKSSSVSGANKKALAKK